jgi:hypothetical protein
MSGPITRRYRRVKKFSAWEWGAGEPPAAVSDDAVWVGDSTGFFPLTPALSPGERGASGSASPGVEAPWPVGSVEFVGTPPSPLPLPWGEGWGEGQADPGPPDAFTFSVSEAYLFPSLKIRTAAHGVTMNAMASDQNIAALDPIGMGRM